MSCRATLLRRIENALGSHAHCLGPGDIGHTCRAVVGVEVGIHPERAEGTWRADEGERFALVETSEYRRIMPRARTVEANKIPIFHLLPLSFTFSKVIWLVLPRAKMYSQFVESATI